MMPICAMFIMRKSALRWQWRYSGSTWCVIVIFASLLLPSEPFIPPGKRNILKYERNDTIVELITRGKSPGRDDSKYFLSREADSGDSLAESAKSLSSFLEKFVDSELGFIETKNLFESTSFDVRRSPSLEEEAKSLASNFSLQIETYGEAVERLVESVKFLSLYNDTLLLEKCCEMSPESFMYDTQYKIEVRKDLACWSAGSKSKTSLFVPSLFSQAMLKNLMKLPYLRWQYFVSPEGVYIEYPSNQHNCRTSPDGPRPVFSPKTHPERKMWLIQKSKEDSRIHRIVFLIQLGRNPTSDAIKSMKNIVLMMLRFLDEADEVGILNVDPVDVSSDFLCDQLVAVTPWTRYQILSYMNYIEQRYRAQSPTLVPIPGELESKSDPLAALNKSVQMACGNFSSSLLFPPSAATVIQLHSEHDVNETLDRLNSPCPIFLESYFLRNLGTEELNLYKTQLQALASKNIWNIQVQSKAQMEPESFAIKAALKLSSKKDWWSLSDILSQFFPDEKKKSTTGAEFSLPHWNPVSKEPVIVAKKYVFYNSHPLGLVAVEIPLVHFTQQITYYLNENVCDAKNYAFMIDTKGRVIAHPALGRPDTSEEVLSTIQIEQVEVYHGFLGLKKRLVSADEPSGCQSLRFGTQNDWVTYAWSRSRVQDYVVVIVAFGESGGCFPDREEMVLRKSTLSPKSDVQHHLLLDQLSCCGHQEQSIHKASLYLAPSAFSKPATSLNPHISTKVGLALMAFLSDNSGLLQNQNKGLKPTVKDHVGVLSNILPMWKDRFMNSAWSQYIQRRFSTAGGGTFMLVYPGIPVKQGYVPHSSSWFRNAVTGNGRLMFTPPEVNSVGTPISSMSILVKALGPSGSEVPIAIIGATVSIGFFQRLVHEIVPDCEKGIEEKSGVSVRCLLLDEGGYVLYHPNLANTLQTSAHVHLTQIEPLSAIDILQSGPNATTVPLLKQTCHKLSDTSATQESLQRFYTLSIPPTGIQKQKHGEICNRYRILPIPNTNLFLGVVHDNCSSAAAFCPCSTVDNLCLNCLRIELSDCECPCECPREPNFCATQGFSDLPGNVEPCDLPVEPFSLDGSHCGNQTSCDLWTPCEGILRKENCVGVHDCEWCENSEVVSPQCTTFEQCYGFLEGRREMVGGKSLNGEVPTSDSSLSLDEKRENESQITVVPILGILAVFLVFLGLVVYCYRHRALRASSSQPDVHLLPLQESPMGSIVPQAGSSRSNSDTEGESLPVPVLYMRRFRRDHGQPLQHPQRSPPGSVFTESDHGYSTMTQNDDPCSEASVSLLHSVPLPISRPEETVLAMNQITTIATTHLPPQSTVPVLVEQATQ